MPVRRRNPVTGELMIVPTFAELKKEGPPPPPPDLSGLIRKNWIGNPNVKRGNIDTVSTWGTKEDMDNYIDRPENPHFRSMGIWYAEREDNGNWVLYIADEENTP